MDGSNLVSIALYVLLGWFLYTRFAPVKGLQNLNAAQFGERLRNAVVIDVREVSEFRSGHIPHAIHIPLGQLGGRIGEIPKQKEVLLYCKSGMRSKQAAKVLKKHGFAKIAHLQGGILAWNGSIQK
ncbi:rhodanese-like domain-containing protein [Brevibacillus fluminis]|uniref:Rhodanese-like domain-containing protein n=1 Tax=Brevibacillus fluminis TaxID=511487 RepID=A0A3M8D2T9_9BACL|nr:rhodanese-like domain-containing protein [Brevibacillus fluminis]RNB82400.1 rhodanese-like domain-containing protein [Brevibacillus fluminis]